MPSLTWIGKDAVVKHHQDVPYRLLEPVPALSCGDADNLIVQGDNLHALKALLPRYAGQVKCIYIDPPYNTGNEGWVYNDNVNSPEIRRWLGEVVGKEGETLDRHDRWLCMMYPRLLLLKQFLREDGAIFISIDDNEQGHLRLLMDEIFGSSNFINNIIWQKKYSPQNDARHLSDNHDFLICYAKNKSIWRPNLLPRTEKQDKAYKNPDNDLRGIWKAGDLSVKTYNKSTNYSITTPSGRIVNPPDSRCWAVNQERFAELLADNRIWFGKDGNNVPSAKRFLTDVKDGITALTVWTYEEVGHNQIGKQELKSIFSDNSSIFDTPKPTSLIERVLQLAADKDSLVLDSFAGSGTTAHAVLKQNAEDGGNRRFILVEMDEQIAQNVTAERVRRVSQGYVKGQNPLSPAPASGRGEDTAEIATSSSGRGERVVAGLGGGFQFCRLSAEPLFMATGEIRPDVTFTQLAEFVWFAETGAAYTGRADSPLLGIEEGRAIYLLYNGILKDTSVGGGNVLTGAVWAVLPKFVGEKVIYAAANSMGALASREGIIFKQTPYALEI